MGLSSSTSHWHCTTAHRKSHSRVVDQPFSLGAQSQWHYCNDAHPLIPHPLFAGHCMPIAHPWELKQISFTLIPLLQEA